MITLSESAIQEIQRLASEMAREGQGLRFFVEGSCCSRSYGMGFDDPREEDQVLETHGVKLLVGPESVSYIQGLAIDFTTGPEGSGFEILSAKEAEGGCCSSGEGASSKEEGGCCRSSADTHSHAQQGGGCCRN